MDLLFILIVGIGLFKLLKKTKENNDSSKIKIVLYSILLMIPLFIGYYFLIAIISGFILNFFGEYMAFYGIILGLAISPLLTIITILKINKKSEKSEDNR